MGRRWRGCRGCLQMGGGGGCVLARETTGRRQGLRRRWQWLVGGVAGLRWKSGGDDVKDSRSGPLPNLDSRIDLSIKKLQVYHRRISNTSRMHPDHVGMCLIFFPDATFTWRMQFLLRLTRIHIWRVSDTDVASRLLRLRFLVSHIVP